MVLFSNTKNLYNIKLTYMYIFVDAHCVLCQMYQIKNNKEVTRILYLIPNFLYKF